VHLVHGTARRLHQAHHRCTDAAEKPQAVVDIFFSSEGINSADLAEQRAANLALSSAMADAPTAIYPALHSALTKAIDHKEHDAISPTEVKIFFTPAGTKASTLQDATALTSMPYWSSVRQCDVCEAATQLLCVYRL